MTPGKLAASSKRTWLSQSAFVRGFIDDGPAALSSHAAQRMSQSAFVRGFIDDVLF